MAATPASFTFVHSNRRVVCGTDSLDRLSDVAREHGARRPVAVLDAFFLGGPVEERLRSLLGEALPCFGVPAHEPDLDSLEACRGWLAAHDPDLIVALGGGSAMDTAKVARMLLSNPGDPSAIAGPVGVRMAPHPSLLVCAPSTAGTGSEVSESAIIAGEGDYKMIFRSQEMTAAVAVLDPRLSVSAPAAVTAASGYDAVTHAVEAFTSKAANPMTDPYALSAMRLLAEHLPVAFAVPGDLEARQGCLIGSLQAAVAFNSANLGLAHAFSGAMGALYHVPHGLANALALPWTMAFNQPALGAKGEVVAEIFGGRTAAEGLARLRAKVGLDLSIDPHLPDAAARSRVVAGAGKSGQLRFNPRTPTPEDLAALLEAMRRPTGDRAPVWPA